MRGDTELKRDVESLLSQYDSAGELLDQPVYGNTELSVLESFVEEKDPMIGRRLGSYRIERKLDAAVWAPSMKPTRR